MESDEARRQRCLDTVLAGLHSSKRDTGRRIFDLAWDLNRQLRSAEGEWTTPSFKEHLRRLVSIRMKSLDQPIDPVAEQVSVKWTADKVAEFV